MLALGADRLSEISPRLVSEFDSRGILLVGAGISRAELRPETVTEIFRSLCIALHNCAVELEFLHNASRCLSTYRLAGVVARSCAQKIKGFSEGNEALLKSIAKAYKDAQSTVNVSDHIVNGGVSFRRTRSISDRSRRRERREVSHRVNNDASRATLAQSRSADDVISRVETLASDMRSGRASISSYASRLIESPLRQAHPRTSWYSSCDSFIKAHNSRTNCTHLVRFD